jgi:alpha-1,3-rhamnosyltransferase
VSVVVPSYNHAQFVARCLRSIINQSLAPLELFVIDDGSSDDSPAIIERTLQQCPFPAELLVRPNRGLSATLNEGLKRSRGKYFAYLGSDDLWLPEFLSARTALLDARPEAVLAYGHAYSIDAADSIIDCTTDWARYIDGDARRMLLTTLAPLSPTVIYRREALERYHWNEKAKLEDYELYLRLSARGDFAFDPRILSAWRQHTANASSDTAMMMTEKLAAQERAGTTLGFSAQELKSFHSLAGFRSAQEFMRNGNKIKAASLALKNVTGINSVRESVRMLAGLITPTAVLKWNTARKQQQATKRYGTLQM